MIKTYPAQYNQSIYDVCITLYGSLEFLDDIIRDNKDVLVNGVETDLDGVVISYNDQLGNASLLVASREEAINLGTQQVFVDSILMSHMEQYVGITFSTTEIDHSRGLFITYSVNPATASYPDVVFSVGNSNIINYSESTSQMYGLNNGTSTFNILATDRNLISVTQSFFVSNQRQYEEIIYEFNQFPVPLTTYTYSLWHNMFDDVGSYEYDNGIPAMWDLGTYAPLPSGVFVPGLMDFGISGDVVNAAVYASYSQVSVSTVSHSDMWYHMTYKNQLPEDSFMEFGLGEFGGVVAINSGGSTVSITSNTGAILDFSIGEYLSDVKYNNNQYLTIDLLMSFNTNMLKLLINGKVVIVNNSTLSAGGEWTFQFGTGDITPYVKNIELGLPKGLGQSVVDDIWLLSLTSGGDTFDQPHLIDTAREILDRKHGA